MRKLFIIALAFLLASVGMVVYPISEPRVNSLLKEYVDHLIARRLIVGQIIFNEASIEAVMRVCAEVSPAIALPLSQMIARRQEQNKQLKDELVCLDGIIAIHRQEMAENL